MKKLLMVLFACVMAMSAFAMKSVNGKAVPEANDWSSFGTSPKYNALDTLLTSLANILPNEAKTSDGINVDSVRTTMVSVSDSVFADTLVTNKIWVGGGNKSIDSVAFIDNGSNDTLLIKINSRKFYIYPTRQE
jgi:hypothetical protein